MAASKPKILLLLTRNPFAEQSGRAFMLRQRIAQIRQTHDPVLVVIGKPTQDCEGHRIKFLPLAGLWSLMANTWRHRGKPMQTWLYFSSPVRQEIQRLSAAAHVQAIYVDMQRLAPLATGLPDHIAVITDYDDLLSKRYQRAADTPDYEVMGFLAKNLPVVAFFARALARFLLRSEARRCAVYELALLRDIDLALFTSPKEAELLRSLAGMNYAPARMPPILAVPPIVEACRHSPAQSGRRLFFLGNLHYAENVIMLRSLAAAVTELERNDPGTPEIKIEVVGDHAPDLASKFDRRYFEFLGRLPDLNTVAGQGIFLAPVTSGSGIKLKILDGMSLGCPVVTTPIGCDGLAVRSNRDLIVASDPAGVLRAALALRDRPRLKAMLTKRAQTYLARAHSPAITAQFSQAVTAAIERARERSTSATVSSA